jgi:hypothetical protein
MLQLSLGFAARERLVGPLALALSPAARLRAWPR